MKILGVDHIAVAVPEIEEALRFWSGTLGIPQAGVEEVAGEKVRVAWLPVPGTHVELVEPLADDSPIRGYLEKRGGGIHHLCFLVEDADAAFRELRERGVRVLGEGPRPGAGGARILFVHPAEGGGVLVELKQKARTEGG
jgi:methylmalonyl-CoA epimerase